MRSSVFILLLAFGCESPDEPQVVKPVVAAAVPERVAPGVPHGGSIQHVAVTENGDAAVTVDTVGGLRLWPTLDGAHEPVPFDINGVEAVAISHAGDELLVGALDESGAVHLVRFSRAGALRGRVQIPGDVAIDQLVAIDGGVLVSRIDQSIERYDAAGKLRGRLIADPSTALGALAVRHGLAAVLVAARETQDPIQPVRRRHRIRKPTPLPVVVTEHASALRWIQLGQLGEGLSWGETIELPANLDAHALAISPSHHRIAVSSANLGQLTVLELPKLTPVDSAPIILQANSTLGFIDEDRASSTLAGNVQWSIAKSAKLPIGPNLKAERNMYATVNDQAGAVADNLYVGGFGTTLMLENVDETRYLGWSDVASGNVIVSGLHVGLETTNTHVIWLDRDLQRESETELADLGYGRVNRVWWLDPNHVVLERASNVAGAYTTDVTLVDFRHRDLKLSLGTYTYIQRVDYYEDLGLVAVVVEGEIRRFKIDLEYDKVTELPKLLDATSMQMVRMLDPARAEGAIAVGASYDEGGERVTTWRDDDAKTIHGTKTKAVLTGGLVGISPNGTLFMRQGVGTDIDRNGKKIFHLADDAIADLVIPNRAGNRNIGIHGADISVYDESGNLMWKQTIWGVQTSTFTTDGTRLVVRTSGGLVLLDAATGARLAAVCGFQFGISTKTPMSNALNTRPICEDSGA